MAFMMPVVKSDYNIYPGYSRTGTPQSSRGSSLASSPTAASFISSPRTSQTPGYPKRSGSQTSLHKFHNKVLDKLRNTFRTKEGSFDHQGSSSVVVFK